MLGLKSKMRYGPCPQEAYYLGGKDRPIGTTVEVHCGLYKYDAQGITEVYS